MEKDNWQTKTIAELGNNSQTTVQTGPFGAQLHSADYVDEGVPLILIRNIGENGLTGELPRISDGDAKRLARYSLLPGDIVFSRVGRVGSCFLATEENAGWIISGQTLRIRLPYNGIDPAYLIYALRNKEAQDFISGSSVGSTRSSINTSILESLPVRLPSFKHQQKIAEVLSTIDRAIKQTEALIAKHQRIKTGLMQDLLTRGIDEHGQLRDPSTHGFKSTLLGMIPEQWEVAQIESRLSDIIDYRGKTPIKTDSGTWLITARNVRDGYLTEEPKEFIATETFDDWMTRGIPSPGDVLFTTEAPMGNVARVPRDKVALGQRILTLVANPTLLDAGFLFWLLQWETTKERLKLMTTGSTVTGIKQAVFRKVFMQFPSTEEQKRIACVLDSTNVKIENIHVQLSKLNHLKTGLMQDLLSGEVSVTPLLEG